MLFLLHDKHFAKWNLSKSVRRHDARAVVPVVLLAAQHTVHSPMLVRSDNKHYSYKTGGIKYANEPSVSLLFLSLSFH